MSEENSKNDKPTFLESDWWPMLPLYIYIAFAVINMIAMAFAGSSASAFLVYVIFAVLMGLLIWFLIWIKEDFWAWFVLLAPLILAIGVSVIASGVAAGNLSAAAAAEWMNKKAESDM